MSTPIVITLPLPSRELSPNSRTHWGRKAREVRGARSDAAWLAVAARLRWLHAIRAIPFDEPKPWAAATITVTPYYRDRRRHDSDNLLASLKPSIDGFVDAGILADDNRVTYTVHPAQVDRERPRVEVEVREGER